MLYFDLQNYLVSTPEELELVIAKLPSIRTPNIGSYDFLRNRPFPIVFCISSRHFSYQDYAPRLSPADRASYFEDPATLPVDVFLYPDLYPEHYL